MEDIKYSKQSVLSYSDEENRFINNGYIINFLHIPTSNSVYFKAIITDFKDNYKSNWKSEDVYGRTDSIENYSNTRRTISLAWDIVAASQDEARDNLDKVSSLLSMLYPLYDGEVISAAPLLKLSFSNLIQDVGDAGRLSGDSSTDSEDSAPSFTNNVFSGLVGRVDGFSNSPVIEYGFFTPQNGILYPKVIRLSCEYTVLHTHKMGWEKDGNPRIGFEKFPYGGKLPSSSDKGFKGSQRDNVGSNNRLEEQQKSMGDKVLNFKKI